MLARLAADQRDGRRPQADDGFGGSVKTMVHPILAVIGQSSWNFETMSGTLVIVSDAVSRLSLSSSTSEIFALKVVIELRSRRK